MKEIISLRALAEKFNKHSAEYREAHDNLVQEFKMNNPNIPLPKHLQDSFNLPEALSLICLNLIDLKSKCSSGVSSEHRDAKLDAASEIVPNKINIVKEKKGLSNENNGSAP